MIFGGAGFIGGRLAKRLASRGDRVVIADVNEPDRLHEHASYRKVDVRETPPQDLAAGPGTVVYLLAALRPDADREPHEHFETNVSGAREIASFAAARGVRKLVFTSSIAVYGPGDEEKTEAARPAPVGAFAWSKLLAERVLEDWADAGADRNLVIARPAIVFGPGEDGAFAELAAALARKLFAYPGPAHAVRDCCYVDDLIESFEFALRYGRKTMLYNFAFPEHYDFADICEAFREAAGLPLPLHSSPAPVARLAAGLFDALARIGLSHGPGRARLARLPADAQITPQVLLEMGFRFPRDLSGALSDWRDDAGALR